MPDRSALILILAVGSYMVLLVGCVACGPLSLLALGLSIPAIVMARRQMQAVDRGEAPRNGRDVALVGMVVSIISAVISVLTGLAMILIMIIYGGLIGTGLLLGAAGAA
ncbi:MAG TPA: hypothetical protein RMH99_22175 [Sandaracinaceae bacterium LLY-WYZ-13_1]|nr:hypothetical protein [Sandaracinaceae bacterium LLY-WYZ-13_1]